MIVNVWNIALLQDIGTVYQIFADEVLGSGQFGVVYGGMWPMMLPAVFCEGQNEHVKALYRKIESV